MSNKPLKPVFPLEDRKSAIVVGSSSGMGAALVKVLTREGYHVAAVARRETELADLCAEINSNSPNGNMANYYVHDVTDFDQVPGLFQHISAKLGGLDLIVYSAGNQPPMAADEYDFSKDRGMVQVNQLGAMAWLSIAAARFERGSAGHIVGISSIAADRGRRLNPGYNSSKAGFETYLEGLRNRLTHIGVSVTTIKPGFVETRLLANSPRSFWVISADKAAEQIFEAIHRKKQTTYIPGRWRFVGLTIRHIPSVIFRRLNF
ncbi:MAG TPA: SDR family NAD(P)-dependent oxidoreductase [Patescibacteria group bacterium]|jgi:short-subunit dehydrogenase|nr:SDR family NAD(P)-dependent oxidoreductase [Patescibacteria group bacterium]